MSRTKSLPAPADPRHLLRRADRAQRYGLSKRWADLTAGRSDGRHDVSRIGPLLSGQEGDDLDEISSMYLARLRRQCAEQLEHETLTFKALTTGQAIRLRSLDEHIDDLIEQLADARSQLAALPDEPRDPLARGAAEARTPEEVLRDRNQRRYRASVLGPARAKAAAIEQQLRAAREERHDAQALLTELADVCEVRKARVREHFARRSMAYRGAYLRRLARRTADVNSPHDPVGAKGRP